MTFSSCLLAFQVISQDLKAGVIPFSLRSFSVDRVMDRVMERNYDFDLTYITERIISVFFPPLLEEQRYRLNLREVAAMLKSKHQDKFLVRDSVCMHCTSASEGSLS